MDVSNSSGTVTDYKVKGVGGGSTAPPRGDVPTGRRRKAVTAKRGKLGAKTFCKVTPPPGEYWIVQFLQGDEVIAEEQVQDSRALVVLVQESDGKFKIHVSRSSSAARSSTAAA